MHVSPEVVIGTERGHKYGCQMGLSNNIGQSIISNTHRQYYTDDFLQVSGPVPLRTKCANLSLFPHFQLDFVSLL